MDIKNTVSNSISQAKLKESKKIYQLRYIKKLVNYKGAGGKEYAEGILAGEKYVKQYLLNKQKTIGTLSQKECAKLI